jgi:hypothetical protein
MKHHFFSSLLLSTVLLISSCSGEEGDPGPQGDSGPQGIQGPKGDQGISGDADTQLRFRLPEEIAYSNLEKISMGPSNLYKFNIDYFAHVDSIIYTVWSSVPNAGNKCSIEIFNITDNVPIAGSLIEVTSNTGSVLYQSANIVDGFPKKEITLGIRIKGNNAGEVVNATGGYLYLYRK